MSMRPWPFEDQEFHYGTDKEKIVALVESLEFWERELSAINMDNPAIRHHAFYTKAKAKEMIEDRTMHLRRLGHAPKFLDADNMVKIPAPIEVPDEEEI